LPLEQVDHIEILRGAAASLYGSDAMGGVIQIFTRQGGKATRAAVEAGFGTDGTRAANASVSGSVGATHYAIGFAHTQTDGINVSNNPTSSSYFPDRDGYRNSSVSASASHKINAENEIGASVLLAKAKNQRDGYVNDALWHAAAQQYDYRSESKQAATNLWSRHVLTEYWTARLQAGYSEDASNDFTPVSDTDLSDVKASYITRQLQFGWQNDIRVGPGTATLGAETLEQRIASSEDYPVRQRRINSLLGGYLVKLGDWNLQTNLRNDDNSQFGNHTSGQAGASWQFLPAWQTGGNIGTGFRAPSFNDLYFPDDGYGNKGNPSLKPETSLNREVFVRYQQGGVKAGLTLFRNRVSNLIEWAPVDPSDTWGAWQPSNVGHALLRGASFQTSWQGKMFNFGGSYDWLDARDKSDNSQLTYRARQSGALYAGVKLADWQLRSELRLVGKRFTNTTNSQYVAGYGLVNLAANWQFARDWQLSARLNNVFDKDYVTVKDYAMPGRNVYVGLRWSM